MSTEQVNNNRNIGVTPVLPGQWLGMLGGGQLGRMFVHAAQAAGAHYACDWTRLTLTAPVRRESVLLDPFDDSPTADFRSLMEALQ